MKGLEDEWAVLQSGYRFNYCLRRRVDGQAGGRAGGQPSEREGSRASGWAGG